MVFGVLPEGVNDAIGQGHVWFFFLRTNGGIDTYSFFVFFLEMLQCFFMCLTHCRKNVATMLR
jgi:hypothetical protein